MFVTGRETGVVGVRMLQIELGHEAALIEVHTTSLSADIMVTLRPPDQFLVLDIRTLTGFDKRQAEILVAACKPYHDAGGHLAIVGTSEILKVLMKEGLLREDALGRAFTKVAEAVSCLHELYRANKAKSTKAVS